MPPDAHLGQVIEERPRDALALNATSATLQDAVGKAYVDKYFPASSKAEIQTMVDNLKAAFARRVKAIAWMSRAPFPATPAPQPATPHPAAAPIAPAPPPGGARKP